IADEWGKTTDGIIPDLTGDPGNMGHAILIVGYVPMNGRRYFIFRNSWGAEWGDSGYGYLSEDYLRAGLNIAYTLRARCSDCPDVPPDCPPGESTSEVDWKCRPVCPDGMLQNDAGECPPPPTCMDGYVPDRSNQCVDGCTPGE